MSELVKTKTIKLDKERTLKFNFKTIMLFEKETGKNFFKMNGEFSGTDTLVLLWACLKSAGEDITLDQTADIIDLSNVSAIGAAITGLIKEAMPNDQKAGAASPLA